MDRPQRSSQERLVCLGGLLGASSGETSISEPFYHQEQRLRDSQSARETHVRIASRPVTVPFGSLSISALSLKHHDKNNRPSDSKNQVQGHAASLLSRQLSVSLAQGTPDFASVPDKLLNNIYESFAVLVISRLRAYSTFLARQGLALANKDSSVASQIVTTEVEKKIEALMETGTRVSVDSVKTHFEVQSLQVLEDEESAELATLPLELQVEMDLGVPRSNGDQEVVHVSFAAPGEITGARCTETNDFEQVHVEIDTRDLLSQMMKQASRIVAIVTDLSNVTIAQETKIIRSESCAAMPPPLPKLLTPSKKRERGGLDLLCNAAANAVERPIVSPDLRAHPYPTFHSMPYIHLGGLHQESKFQDAVAEHSPPEGQDCTLSADQCANIVDCIFGDLDDAVLVCLPPKRRCVCPSP